MKDKWRTCQPPQSRADKIRQSIEILNYQLNEYMHQFGLCVSNEMIITQARVLPTPTLLIILLLEKVLSFQKMVHGI
jgi:hypothetical protein